jgi:two-component system, OmpR family, response regulator
VKPQLEKILLVEDDPDIRTIVKAALEMMGGFQVKACASGSEALDAVAGFAPQLALLDVMMPDMDGPGVLAKLRGLPQTAGMPVIFLTAKTAASEIQRLRALGAAGVLMKPFDPMTLSQQVREIWEQAKAG